MFLMKYYWFIISHPTFIVNVCPVYLRTSPETCMERIKSRCRSEEKTIPMVGESDRTLKVCTSLTFLFPISFERLQEEKTLGLFGHFYKCLKMTDFWHGIEGFFFVGLHFIFEKSYF